MGYKTGTIEKVPVKKDGKAVDGLILSDDGTPYKFKWPSEFGEGKKKMSRGARVLFYGEAGRASGIKKSFATGTQRY